MKITQEQISDALKIYNDIQKSNNQDSKYKWQELKGFSQTLISKKIGVSKPVLSRSIASGYASPHVTSLLNLLVFQIRLARIISTGIDVKNLEVGNA